MRCAGVKAYSHCQTAAFYPGGDGPNKDALLVAAAGGLYKVHVDAERQAHGKELAHAKGHPGMSATDEHRTMKRRDLLLGTSNPQSVAYGTPFSPDGKWWATFMVTGEARERAPGNAASESCIYVGRSDDWSVVHVVASQFMGIPGLGFTPWPMQAGGGGAPCFYYYGETEVKTPTVKKVAGRA